MANNQNESLEDRLAKRRRLRNRRFVDKNSVDESEIKLINQSPTTRSLDRKSSKRINSIPNEQRKSSSTITKNRELPPIDPSYTKQNHLLADNKTNSTPILPQITRYQAYESENEKQSSPKSSYTYEQQYDKPVVTKETVTFQPLTEKADTPAQSKTYQDEKSMIATEMVTPRTSTVIQSDFHEQIKSYPDEKPVVMKTTVSPIQSTEKSRSIPEEINEKPVIMKEIIAPTFLPRTTIEKPKPIARESSLPNRGQSYSQPSEPIYPSSHPQSTTGRQDNHFNFSLFPLKPIARTTSEQIVSTSKYKHEPIIPILAQPDSLALSYLFNKRMISASLAHPTSSNNHRPQRKTVWD